MGHREIIVSLRNEGKLKGIKPCYVLLKSNIGNVYKGKTADFIMSLKNDKLCFQRLSYFFHVLKPEDDFSIDLSTIKFYSLEEGTLGNTFFIYNDNRCFLPIYYNKGIPDTYQTEDNILRIIKTFEEKNIKKIIIGDNKNE